MVYDSDLTIHKLHLYEQVTDYNFRLYFTLYMFYHTYSHMYVPVGFTSIQIVVSTANIKHGYIAYITSLPLHNISGH